MNVIYVILGLIVLIAAYAISIYNKLIRRRNLVEEGWSGIDVQLKRRANVIPNLVEAVKGYASHESEVFEQVAALRSRSMDAGTVKEQGVAEGLLGAALGRLMAVAEDYPELQADENFRNLQDELSSLENEIQMARRYYNGTVRELNVLIESFPSNIVANQFKFITAEYFEIEDQEDRAVPEVSFS
jgi:LemA protein